MKNDILVEILIATYNGEKYISEQLESLLSQTYDNIHILIRDDGSKDRTIDIIKEYERKYPDKIQIIEDNIICKNSTKNFLHLIQYANAEYIMLCDQDDVWKANKIECTLAVMLNAESHTNGPILVYSDYQLVNKNLEPLNINRKELAIENEHLDLPHLLIQNYYTGCCGMMNKRLYKNIYEYCEGLATHDWWIAIYAAAFGKIIRIPEGLMLYRQHDKQVVGALRTRNLRYIFHKMLDRDGKRAFEVYISQAKAFKATYGARLDKEQLEIIEALIQLPELSKIKKIKTLFKYRFLKNSIIRILGEIVRV